MYGVLFKCSNIRIKHLESKKVQLYSQDSLDASRISLRNVNGSLNHDDLTDLWNTLKKTLLSLVEQSIPTHLKKKLNKLPWMNQSLKLLLSKQRRNSKYKKTNSKRVNMKCLHVCKEVKSAIGQAENKYINILCKGAPNRPKNCENVWDLKIVKIVPIWNLIIISVYVYLLIFATS